MTLPGAVRDRAVRLIAEAVERLGINLRGLTVLTEAGSGHYAVTPAIARAAGADRVVAVTRDSQHGYARDIVVAAQHIASQVSGTADVEFVIGKPQRDHFAAADIVTNLGFVRPIDAPSVDAMKTTAAVPLMCEAWELRHGDVDIVACRQRGIPVLGTNEDVPEVDVFGYAGTLGVSMVLQAGLEVRKCRIVVFGPDRFGPVICRALTRAEAAVTLVTELASAKSRANLSAADALLIAAYSRVHPVIGTAGDITAEALGSLAPGLTIVQFAGGIDSQGLRDNGVRVFPEEPVGPIRMARTLAHLGPRPVIDLHAAGLKVGELATRARRSGLPVDEVETSLAARYPLVQIVHRP